MDELTSARPSYRVLKLILLAIFILLFAALFLQVYDLRASLFETQAQLTLTANQLNNLQNANNILNSALKDTQNAQADLKSTQLASAGLSLLQLRHDVLNSQSKNILLNDFTNLQALTANLHIAQINTGLNQIQNALNALPTVNPANAITQLNNLQASLASLSFVQSVTIAPESTSVNDLSLHNLWQKLKSLIIVRTDNSIGAQLVSDATRFDAVRQISLLLQEAQWQIIRLQDPSDFLTQARIMISAYTQADQNQAAWLGQLSRLQGASDFYTKDQIQPLLQALNNLQQAFNLQ